MQSRCELERCRRDWLLELLAPPGGGTYMSESARCAVRNGQTMLTHASMTRDFEGLPFGVRHQIFFDVPFFNARGTDRLAQQFALLHATRRAMRAAQAKQLGACAGWV